MSVRLGFATAWLACSSVVLAGTAAGQATTRVSLASTGAQTSNESAWPSITPDGRFVAFGSFANNLVSGDTNGAYDVFVRDRLTWFTERVSVDSNGVQGNAVSATPVISGDGRYVAFGSDATNLVPGDTNASADVFVHDRLSGSTIRVTVDSAGNQANDRSYSPSFSADGRYVCFYGLASNLVPGDTNNLSDVFVHDCQAGTTVRVSVDSNGVQGNGTSGDARMSGDGRFVVFSSIANNLVPGDTNGWYDIFVHDLQTGVTTRASVNSSGVETGGFDPRISDDGRFVLFLGISPNLPGGVNGYGQVYLRDMQSGVTTLVSAEVGGALGNDTSEWCQLSGDGRYAAFVSYATNLVLLDTNSCADVFVRDILLGVTRRVSINSAGVQGNQLSGVDIHNSPSLCISGNARFVAFGSLATNLVADDSNGFQDIFVHDLAADGFTSVCDPGSGGVIACPCANPPAGPGRGCDNSSATGGAQLTSSGDRVPHAGHARLHDQRRVAERPEHPDPGQRGDRERDRLRSGRALPGWNAAAPAVRQAGRERFRPRARRRLGRHDSVGRVGRARRSDPPRREPLVPRLLPRPARARRLRRGEYVQHHANGSNRLVAVADRITVTKSRPRSASR